VLFRSDGNGKDATKFGQASRLWAQEINKWTASALATFGSGGDPLTTEALEQLNIKVVTFETKITPTEARKAIATSLTRQLQTAKSELDRLLGGFEPEDATYTKESIANWRKEINHIKASIGTTNAILTTQIEGIKPETLQGGELEAAIASIERIAASITQFRTDKQREIKEANDKLVPIINLEDVEALKDFIENLRNIYTDGGPLSFYTSKTGGELTYPDLDESFRGRWQNFRDAEFKEVRDRKIELQERLRTLGKFPYNANAIIKFRAIERDAHDFRVAMVGDESRPYHSFPSLGINTYHKNDGKIKRKRKEL
jgi:hypothetical protein